MGLAQSKAYFHAMPTFLSIFWQSSLLGQETGLNPHWASCSLNAHTHTYAQNRGNRSYTHSHGTHCRSLIRITA